MPTTTTTRAGAFADAQRNGNGNDLSRVDTLSLDPEVFEKLYLNPQTAVKHDLAKTFAIPTPLALVGISIALTPLSCCLMGWRGAEQQKLGNADIGAYLWFGGFTVIISALMEFVLGNTFSFVLFMGYGGWFLTYGATLQPFYNAAGAYAGNSTAPGATPGAIQEAGEVSAGFPASFGFIVVFMAVFSFIMLICSIRVNVVLVVLLSSILMGFLLIAASLFVENNTFLMLAEAETLQKGGDALAANAMLQAIPYQAKLATKLVTGGGAAFFVASMMNWYLLLATLLLAVDFPILIGVYDLSTIVPGKSDIDAEHRSKKEARFRELEEERIRLEQELNGVKDANARGRAHLAALEKTIAELREHNNLLAIKETGGAKQK